MDFREANRSVEAYSINMKESNARETLRLFRRAAPVRVLGPGQRAVIWVQGCPFACHNCIVPESWDAEGGEEVEVAELAAWALMQPNIEGITLSGGEPMLQAAALSCLVDTIRQKRDLGVVCYTGFTLEHLRERGSPAQQCLLERTDLLIDGVYIEREHTDRLWRGSANQRLLPLTERYRALVESLSAESDHAAGMEFFWTETGRLGFAGVPNRPGFREEFTARMRNLGIALTTPASLLGDGEETQVRAKKETER